MSAEASHLLGLPKDHDVDYFVRDLHHVYRSGRFYFPSRITVSWMDVAWSFPTGFSYAYPLYSPRKTTFNLLRCDVTGAVAGAFAKYALYGNKNGYPYDLFATLGEVNCGTTGIKDITINVTVQDLVFFAFTVSNGSVAFRGVDPGYCWDFYGSVDVAYRGANCFRGNQFYLDDFYNPFSLNVPSSWAVPFCIRVA